MPLFSFGVVQNYQPVRTPALLRKRYDTPQVYQFDFHKDRGLNRAMMESKIAQPAPH